MNIKIYAPAAIGGRGRAHLLHTGAIVVGLAFVLPTTPAFASDTSAPVETPAQNRDDIVVTGERSGTRDGAREEKKNSTAVTSVMSAEEIAEHPGGTIVDVLAHLPGLSSFSDMGLGQAATGEQEYVTIRGIDSSYNSYTLNGVRVPQADPGSRALSLKLLPPFGIQSVRVTKTPTVDMDGDAVGGSIDIRTPTAFDFGKTMVQATVQGNFSQMASDTGATAGGFSGQLAASHRYGDNFGVYVTAYYDRRNSAGQAVESTGYTPVLAAEAEETDYTKLTQGLAATGVRFDYYRNKITRYGGNISLDYHGATQRWYLQASYAHYQVTGEDTQHSILSGLGALYVNGTDYSPYGIMPGSYFQERDQTQKLATIKAGGSSQFGRLAADYSFSYGESRIARPNYVEGSLYAPPIAGYATDIGVSDPAHVNITWDSDATRDYVLSQNTDKLWKFQGSDSGSSERMYVGKADFKYDTGLGVLDRIDFGASVNFADRDQYQHQFFGNNGDNFVILGPDGEVRPYTDGAGPTVANMPGRNLSSFLDGSYGGVFRAYDRSIFENSVLPYKYTSQYGKDPTTGAIIGNPGAYTANDYNRNTVTGHENIVAAYVAANFKFDALQATLGLRYENTDFSASHYVVDGATGSFEKSGNNYDEFLPSLIVNYRPTDQLVFRGAIRRSFARPAFGLIASPVIISRNDITGEIQGISSGNPDLKPTEAWNYDATAEWYGPHSRLIALNLYYKHLNNFIYAATSSGSPPPANSATINNGGVVTSIPENGKDAELWGLELEASQKFDMLPGVLSGLGLQGSLTLQHSSADSGRADHFGRRTWLPRAPRTIYNIDLFYEKHGVRTDLTYQYQGLQLVGLTSNNLDSYLQPVKTLDFSLAYTLKGVTLTFSAKNLANDIQFYKTLGKGRTYLGTQDGGGNGSYVATGRFFSLAASYRW